MRTGGLKCARPPGVGAVLADGHPAAPPWKRTINHETHERHETQTETLPDAPFVCLVYFVVQPVGAFLPPCQRHICSTAAKSIPSPVGAASSVWEIFNAKAQRREEAKN